MLTANKILQEIDSGNIVIDPFNIDQLNPNSYNVTLNNILKVYSLPKARNMRPIIDMKNADTLKTIDIDLSLYKNGFILIPGTLYLGSTKEKISSDKYISAIDGRSSIGRLGISIHSTAGFGDIGFSGTYTLEISVVQPVKIYSDILIGQIYFTKPEGEIDFLYNGRYKNQQEPTPSKIYMNSNTIPNYHYKKD